MTVLSTSEDHRARGAIRAFVLVAGVIAFLGWGTRAASALDPSDVTAPVEAVAPIDEVSEAVAPVTDASEEAAPVEEAAPAAQRVTEPVTETVEEAAPAAQRVTEPVTGTVEEAAPAAADVITTAPVEELTGVATASVSPLIENARPVAQVVEDLAPVTQVVENTVGRVTSYAPTAPSLGTISAPLLLPTVEPASGDASEPAGLRVERSPWEAVRSLSSMTMIQPSSLIPGTFAPDGEAGSQTDPDVPGPGKVPVEIPLADWGGILETGGRGLTQIAAFLSVAIMLAVGISRWIRPIAYARAPNPFLSSIELPG